MNGRKRARLSHVAETGATKTTQNQSSSVLANLVTGPNLWNGKTTIYVLSRNREKKMTIHLYLNRLVFFFVFFFIIIILAKQTHKWYLLQVTVLVCSFHSTRCHHRLFVVSSYVGTEQGRSLKLIQTFYSTYSNWSSINKRINVKNINFLKLYKTFK